MPTPAHERTCSYCYAHNPRLSTCTCKLSPICNCMVTHDFGCIHFALEAPADEQERT